MFLNDFHWKKTEMPVLFSALLMIWIPTAQTGEAGVSPSSLSLMVPKSLKKQKTSTAMSVFVMIIIEKAKKTQSFLYCFNANH